MIAVWPLSAASPAISASRGFWRRCHGLRSCHSAFSSLGGIASQMIGLVMLRYVIEVEPLASMDKEVLVATYAPTLQRYLDGDLPPT